MEPYRSDYFDNILEPFYDLQVSHTKNGKPVKINPNEHLVWSPKQWIFMENQSLLVVELLNTKEENILLNTEKEDFFFLN